eukprot:3090365-Prymnesium_polylepis.2
MPLLRSSAGLLADTPAPQSISCIAMIVISGAKRRAGHRAIVPAAVLVFAVLTVFALLLPSRRITVLSVTVLTPWRAGSCPRVRVRP